MKIELKNADKWYRVYKKLNKEQRYKYVLETINNELSVKFFEKNDIVGIILNTLDYLRDMRLYKEMIELYDRLQRWKEYIDEWYYFEKYPIDYYLYCGDISKVRKHLEGFRLKPEKSIDIFIPTFDKLIYYGYSDITMDVSLWMYDKIKDAPGLLSGSEDQYGKIIYMEKLQDIYNDLKNNIPVHRDTIVKYLERYGYETESYIDLTIDALSPQKELWPDREMYQVDESDFFHCLKLQFCRYMLDSKNVTFATSRDIWDVFLYSIKCGSPNNESVRNYDNTLELDLKRYDNQISARMDFLSNKFTCGFAVAWGMVYLYDFLYNHGYISDKVYHSALTDIQTIKDEIIRGNTSSLWEYNFVNVWVKPDSIGVEEHRNTKVIFDESFNIQIRR
jgi:hypothetical protein